MNTIASPTIAYPEKPFARISWGAIFAGAIIALSLQLILSLIGIGIGLSTVDPQTNDNPSGAAIGFGAVLWWTISSLVSLYIGGMIAGRIAGSFNGFLHGLITWALVTMGTVLLLTSALGAAFRGVTGLAQFATEQMPRIEAQMPEAAQKAQAGAEGAINQAQSAANDPAARQQAENQAREAGEKAATGGAWGSIGAALALLLGAAAASIGGKNGHRIFLQSRADDMDEVPDDTLTSRTIR